MVFACDWGGSRSEVESTRNFSFFRPDCHTFTFSNRLWTFRRTLKRVFRMYQHTRHTRQAKLKVNSERAWVETWFWCGAKSFANIKFHLCFHWIACLLIISARRLSSPLKRPTTMKDHSRRALSFYDRRELSGIRLTCDRRGFSVAGESSDETPPLIARFISVSPN